ncbi:MAG: leucine-rich repeat domain-containing protein [Bacteroidota bacterium]
MGNLTEANNRIGMAFAEGSNTLKLSGLELTTDDLNQLLPRLKRLNCLEELDLSNNEFRALPDGIGNLTDLTNLNISGNGLERLPDSIGNFTELESLNVSYNSLTALPKTLTNLKCLKYLNASKNRLSSLPDEIRDLSLLKVLIVNGNRLNRLPSSIGELKHLENLDIHKNSLSELPLSIGGLTNLAFLNASDNQLTNLRPEIGSLENPIGLNLSINRLTSLPETMARMNITNLQLTNNPLSMETMHWLRATFPPGVVHTNMAAHGQYYNALTTLEDIYCNEVEAKSRAIASLSLGHFEIEGGQMKTAPEMLKELFQKAPIDDAQWTVVYKPALRHLLDQVIDTRRTEEDRKGILQQLATSLGDCPTPIKSFLVQAFIGQHSEEGAELPQSLHALVARVAVEQKVVQALRDQLADNEKIEQVQGLVNSLFMEGAETNDHNQIPIMGDRERLPPVTAYPEFAFDQVTDTLAGAFAQLCCKTGAEGQLVKEGGSYQLDQGKLNGIVEPFFAAHGIVSQRERYVNGYRAKVEPFLKESGLILHPEKDDVRPLLEIPVQQRELREMLLGVSDSEVAAVYARYLDAQMAALAATSAKYHEGELSEMTTPLNRAIQQPRGGELSPRETKGAKCNLFGCITPRR